MTTHALAPSHSPLLSLLSRVRAYRWALALALVAALAQHGLSIAAAVLTGLLIGHAAGGRTDLAPEIVLLCASVAGAGAGAWLSAHFAHVFAYRHQAALRLTVLRGLDRSAPRRMLGERTGELGATAMGDVDALEMFFAHLAIGVSVAAIVGGAAVLVLAWIHPLFALLAAAGMVMSAFLPERVAARVKETADSARDELGALNADVVDGIQGMRELLLFGRVGPFVADLVARTRRYASLQRRASRAGALQVATSEALVSFTTLACLIVAVLLVRRGTISWTEAVVATLVTAAAFAPVGEAVGIAGGLSPLRTSANRVLAIAEAPRNVPDTGVESLHGAPPRIEFENVRFGYEEGKLVLDGVSFAVEPGETVALVGASGAGKSTCMNLILRFWDVQEGRVLVGGRDVRRVRTADLRRFVAPVPQDVYVFHASVAENLRLGRPDAPQTAVERAARAARAHDFIASLPEGYDTQLGERGARLSGGQRQRLAIARALVLDAPILLLDEAASNLDSENERAIQEALRAARQGRTTLVIAHRPSTIRAADRIVVLDGGRVAEMGTHDELLRAGGVYARVIAAGTESRRTADDGAPGAQELT
ncbi:ABC transporter ATP-binding protein [Sorangium sp. So ce134]